jgi:EAL domain-containing protein (putative c-di-GMP-specific phosphodiesterase class I)
LRWRHPERGLVSPVEFIPILETSGLILDVGQWVIEEACRQLQVWHEMGVWEEGMKLSINISPRQFRRQAFVDDVAKILHHIPIPEKSLDMEITEGVVIHNVEEAISTLTTLTSMGISFSLDDFGTGYSSISYLKRLPVSTLKIDRSFIRDISYDRSDRVLVETIITMGRLLDLNVIAEGVEDKEQVEILKGFNCDSYQGFLFCKPLMVEEFQQLLIAEEKSLRQSV